MLSKLWPVGKLRAENEYLRKRLEESRALCDRLDRENNKLVEHMAIQNGMIQRAREILNRQRVMASNNGEL